MGRHSQINHNRGSFGKFESPVADIRMKVKILILVLLLCLSAMLRAQLCTGTLGNPTATVTFGSLSNPISITSNTSYTYNSSGCPAVGEYSLPYLSFDCATGGWHTIVADHSAGDVNGLFMLVNAAALPSKLYSGSVSGLCGGTGYEFSFWVMNVVKLGTCDQIVSPNLEYTVETMSGTVIATGTSGSLAATDNPTWKKVGISFQPPAGVTDFRFTISSKATGGCGNSFAIDDIEFAPCGPDINATIGPQRQTFFQVCFDAQQAIQFNGNYGNGYSNPKFQWQVQSENTSVWNDIPGATSNNYTRPPSPTAGIFVYRLAIGEGNNINSPSCRIYSSPITVYIEPNPDAQLTSYVYGCYGGTVVLYAAGGSSYYWTGPNGFSSSQQLVTMSNIKFTDAGIYKVRVTTNTGCPGFDSLNLVIYPAANISVGNGASVCEGTPVNLTASGGIQYRWWPPDDLSNDTIPNPVARPKNTTIFHVKVTNQYGCSDTSSIQVNVSKKPKADAGPDKKIRPGLQVQLDGKVIGTNADFFWTPADFMASVNSLRPTVSPPSTTIYTLHAVSTEGCGSTTDEVKVVVYDKIIIPNAFSPNNDAVNDTWFIEPLYLFPECLVEVYNRYGQIVYRSNGYDKPWDGKRNGQPLPIGVYYYTIDLKVQGKLPLTGSVTILR